MEASHSTDDSRHDGDLLVRGGKCALHHEEVERSGTHSDNSKPEEVHGDAFGGEALLEGKHCDLTLRIPLPKNSIDPLRIVQFMHIVQMMRHHTRHSESSRVGFGRDYWGRPGGLATGLLLASHGVPTTIYESDLNGRWTL